MNNADNTFSFFIMYFFVYLLSLNFFSSDALIFMLKNPVISVGGVRV